MRLETIGEKREREAREFFKRNALDIRAQYWQQKEAGGRRAARLNSIA